MMYKGILLIALLVIGLIAIIFLSGKKSFIAVAEVGKPAPEYELYDFTGRLWRLSDLRGNVVFINFWATWCTSCKAEKPSMERLYEKMGDKPFQMLGVLVRDNPRNLIQYFQEQKVSQPTLISPNNDIARLYGITGVPETFIIDKDGIIREKILGPREWDHPENIAMIEKWLYAK